MEPSEQNQLCLRVPCHEAQNATLAFQHWLVRSPAPKMANLHLCLSLDQVCASRVNPRLTVLRFIRQQFQSSVYRTKLGLVSG